MTHIVWFLLGFVSTASLVAGVFFLKFWKSTGDLLFAAFAAFFVVEAISEFGRLFIPRPNEGAFWIYALRLAALLGILAAILRKNYGRSR
jgi:hypothetical protein